MPLRVFCWVLFFPVTLLMFHIDTQAADLPDVQAENLLRVGRTLVEKRHYLEALDLFEEARDFLESTGIKNTGLYPDILFELAQTKIRGRLHQNFPANYVKSALEDIQSANRSRERLADVLPQKLAEGYYLEGFIQKKFFMRNDIATSCFVKAVKIDPGFIAAKRELSELVADEKPK
ncbi:MAG: hypothetical protein NTW27_09890 [Deltaproteobacteria bacterium]|nr:hypothetical protein [Deltaproteobacteria bacterium]